MIEKDAKMEHQGEPKWRQLLNNACLKIMVKFDTSQNKGINQPWLILGSIVGDARGGAGFGDFRLMPPNLIRSPPWRGAANKNQ